MTERISKFLMNLIKTKNISPSCNFNVREGDKIIMHCPVYDVNHDRYYDPPIGGWAFILASNFNINEDNINAALTPIDKTFPHRSSATYYIYLQTHLNRKNLKLHFVQI